MSPLILNGAPPSLFDLTVTFRSLILTFSTYLHLFLQKGPFTRAERLKHDNVWLNVMTFISQATCMVILPKWWVRISVSSIPTLLKGWLLGGNNYFSAGTALMTFTFTSTSITALCEPLCVETCAWALCLLVYIQYLLLLHFMCVNFHWLTDTMVCRVSFNL